MMARMTSLARRERQALCDTFDQVGPTAPTLCEPWDTADLAAHLVIRERRPDLAPGIYVPALGERTDEKQRGYAAKPWPELVALVRGGPPAWSPTRVTAVDDIINLGEFFIHHEDVLRASGDGPRPLDDRLERALWRILARTGRMMFRRTPTGVVLVTDRSRAAVKGPTGPGTVVLRGRPGELVLLASGRGRVADVAVEGPDAAVSAFEESDLRLG